MLIVASFMVNKVRNSRSDCEFVNVEGKFDSNPSMNGKLLILIFYPSSFFFVFPKILVFNFRG